MISEATLLKEREDYLARLENRYTKKIENFKEKEGAKIKAKLEKFSSSHDETDTACYKISLELSYSNKLKKLQDRYSKKLAKKTVKSEIADKERISNAKRVWEIDVLRGIAIWGMIFDHFTADFWMFFKDLYSPSDQGWLGALSSMTQDYWSSSFRTGVRLFGLFLFVFLCGVSTRFSKNNLKRSLGLIGFGLAITLALFGISKVTNNDRYQVLLSTITTIGLCLFIYTITSTLYKKIFGAKSWKWVSLGLFFAICIMWAFVSAHNYLVNLGKTPQDLLERFYFVFNNNGDDISIWPYGYQSINADNWWKFIVGTQGFGADWLGLFPYVGYIFLGGFVGETVYKDKKSIIKYFYCKEDSKLTGEEYFLSRQGQKNAKINEVLSLISYPGRHTLSVYVFHQPFIFLFMFPIFLISGYHFTLFG